MLSTVILTKNEEENIVDCIESVSFSDEIIIIDDNSQDRTVEIIENLKDPRVRVYIRPLDENFAAQRNFGIEKATGDWIFFIDPDERVSNVLKMEIIRAINMSRFIAYRVKREDYMWGKTLKYGEVGNIFLLRLSLKRVGKGKWHGKVHEEWSIEGLIGDLENPLQHFPHQNLSDFLREIDYYSSIRAKELYDQRVTSGILQIIMYPKAKFFVNYVIKQGYKDGTAGFVVAMIMSFHSFLVRSKLYLISRNDSK